MAGPTTSNRATLLPGVPYQVHGPDVTEPYAVAPAQQSQQPPPQYDERAMLMRSMAMLGESVATGRIRLGPAAWGFIGGLVGGLLIGGGLWASHLANGDRGLSETLAATTTRLDEQDRRLGRVEREQTWSRWALTSIAKAVNADLPPPIDEP